MEQFNQRLHFPSSVTNNYNDTQRWISIENSLFDELLQTAEQEKGNKVELILLKRKIVSGIINLRTKEESTVLLTEREFYAGLIQYLPWNGNMTVGTSFIRVLIKNKPELLNIGANFWHPNDVRLIKKS